MDLTFLENTGAVIEKNAPLSKYTTFQIGGPSPCIITCSAPSQIGNVVKKLNEQSLRFIVIGSGSNLLVSDMGIDCVVVRYVNDNPDIKRENNNLTVSAGTSLDEVAELAANNGLEGINFASGIPGTVGGAIVGNAGAFGKQIGDCVESVILMDKEGKVFNVGSGSLGFRYRYSLLKETGNIVISAEVALKEGSREALLKERKEILENRKAKHPNWKKQPTAGSFFRNIEPTSKGDRRKAAGWLLEQAGAKEMCVGGASVFPKHANIIVAEEGCKAQDVYELSKIMQKAVKEKFNISLKREVRLAGKFKSMPENVARKIW